ncbi:MAG TPA: nucleotide pyrophosphohydrolase [Anaerolineae bacterium]|nr:nucleotide pyrophosphohydrolase [Anaerolineae bacterium]
MTEKTLSALQAEVDGWISSAGGGYWSPHVNVARLAEEVGELARLVNHLFGPKPKKATEEPQELGEELADILFVLICMANSQGIRLDAALDSVIAKVRSRDSHRFLPKGGIE